jgi:hypothetical protein
VNGVNSAAAAARKEIAAFATLDKTVNDAHLAAMGNVGESFDRMQQSFDSLNPNVVLPPPGSNSVATYLDGLQQQLTDATLNFSPTLAFDASLGGSPRLPFSDYITRYVPSLLKDLSSKVTPVLFKSNSGDLNPGTVRGTAGSSFDGERLVSKMGDLERQVRANNLRDTNNLLRRTESVGREQIRAIDRLSSKVGGSRVLSSAEANRLATGRRS